MGLVLINTILNNRWDLHLQRLRESVDWGNAKAIETLNNLTMNYGNLGSDAPAAALKTLSNMLRREAW